MSDYRIFAPLKLLSSDMNEAYEAHFFFPLCVRVYVCRADKVADPKM